MSQTFKFGQVYYVDDRRIVFPDNRRRAHHKDKNRPVVILDEESEYDHSENPLITIAPCSTKLDYLRMFDVDMPESESPLKRNSIIRVGCLQSVLKRDLKEPCKGEVSDNIKRQIYIALAAKFGFDQD